MKPVDAITALLLLSLSGPAALGASGSGPSSPATMIADPIWQPPSAHQVRIEQHFSIRITPGQSMMPQQMPLNFDQDDTAPRFAERKMSKCLPISAISSVQGGTNDRLLLLLRDQRLISATLEKSCRPRDFYSGFYLEHNADGQICIGRDRLQSRNGVSCKIKRLHELAPPNPRRAP